MSTQLVEIHPRELKFICKYSAILHHWPLHQLFRDCMVFFIDIYDQYSLGQVEILLVMRSTGSNEKLSLYSYSSTKII